MLQRLIPVALASVLVAATTHSEVTRMAPLTGRLVLPKGVSPPASIEANIQSALVPPARIECPVTKTTFRCMVPATPLDVRLAVNGFAPRYYWSVEPSHLGDVALARGGSLSGTIRFDGDAPPLNTVALELKPVAAPPMNEGWSTAETRLASRDLAVRPNERGFFQFAQLEPGRYTLIAKKEGWSRARRTDLEVRDGEETALPQPVVIEPLAEVDVFIQPALDPYGKPWQVSLREMVPLSSMSTPVVETSAELTGAWSAAGIESGAYRIEILDHRGSGFASSIVEVAPRMAPVTIAIESVLVRGTLRTGDDPLRAQLQFRNGKGTMISMHSDAEGRFAGALPREGKWDVIIATPERSQQRRVDVRPENGVAELDLRLPDTRIAGTVVDTNGDPATAFVRVWSETRAFLGAANTAADGTFSMAGIDPGLVYLEAESRASENAKSGFVPVRIGDAPVDDVALVLRPASRLRARLTTPSGLPVAGAIVRYLLPDRPGQTMEEVSGPNGTFTIALSPGTPYAELVILPPALPVKIVRVPLTTTTADIVLGQPSAMLEIEVDPRGPFPWIEHRGVTYSVGSLRYPANWTAPPRDFRPWGMAVELESGEYVLCGDRTRRDHCVRKLLAPGAVERVNGKALVE